MGSRPASGFALSIIALVFSAIAVLFAVSAVGTSARRHLVGAGVVVVDIFDNERARLSLEGDDVVLALHAKDGPGHVRIRVTDAVLREFGEASFVLDIDGEGALSFRRE